MKKVVIFLAIILICLSAITYLYMVSKSNETTVNQYNMMFEKYYQKEVYG